MSTTYNHVTHVEKDANGNKTVTYFQNTAEDVLMPDGRTLEDRDLEITKTFEKMSRNILLTLLKDNWEENDQGQFTQRVMCNQIEKSDNPDVTYYLPPNSNSSQILQIKQAFACLDDGDTYDGYLIFTCDTAKPNIDLPILVRGY